MKAVIYARYSPGANQTEQSIEGQLRECYEYAKAHDITIVDTYIDRKLSGTNDNRTQFQKMIKDSDKLTFDAVLLYKIDRFARNRYDSAIYKARLKKNGVKVLYAKESIPDGPEGIILESLLEGMAEYYSAELSQKIRRGMRESALKCHVTGGNMALGYRAAADKSFEIDPETAPIVQKIFEMYDSGIKVVDICKELNGLGYRTSRGALYNKNSLRTILKNRKYIGIYACQDIEVENGVPAIIDKELFFRVQDTLIENKKAPAKSKAKVDYLLSGKLYCGQCKGTMIGECGTSKQGTKHYYYTCSHKKREKTCSKKTVRKEWLERLVVEETARHILQPAKINLIAEKCVSIQEQDISANEELIFLNKQLSSTKKSIANIMSAIEQGIILKTTKERLAELEEAQSKLEYQISMCELSQPELTKEQIIFMLSQYQNYDLENEEYCSNMIECFVHSVHLSDNRLIVVYNLTNEKTEFDSSVLDLIGGGEHAISEHVYFIKNLLILSTQIAA